MVNVPPWVSTRTGESTSPRRIPVTAAAQAPVPQASVSPARRDDAAQRLDADLALVRELPQMDEAHEAARAIAALLDLSAVGIEDAVAKVGRWARGLLHDEDLVAPDAEMPVGDFLELRGIE